MLYKNENYHILLKETEIDDQQVDLYFVINNYTGVIEHRTFILPDALQTAEEFNEALIQFEMIYDPNRDNTTGQETLH